MIKHFPAKQRNRAFTLMETMIALGVMTVMITGFLAVFGPATISIRKALSTDEINRMQATLKREMGTLREGTGSVDSTYQTSFKKAMDWIANSHKQKNVVILYKYRGDPSDARAADGTLSPVTETSGKAGKSYVIQPMARRIDDPLLEKDLAAVEGRAFFVTMTQLVFGADGSLKLGTKGKIIDPTPGGEADPTGNALTYPEAVIAYEGSFYILPTVSYEYISGGDFKIADFDKPNNNPVFTRNMAVRR